MIFFFSKRFASWVVSLVVSLIQLFVAIAILHVLGCAFFARKEDDIKTAKLQKDSHRKRNYNQAPLQPDYASAVDEPVARRSPLLADALDRSSP
jgi:hypothetical protein